MDSRRVGKICENARENLILLPVEIGGYSLYVVREFLQMSASYIADLRILIFDLRNSSGVGLSGTEAIVLSVIALEKAEDPQIGNLKSKI